MWTIWERIRLQFVSLRRAFKLVWEASRGYTLASFGLLLAESILPVVELYLIKLTIDTVTAVVSAPDVAAQFGQVVPYIALLGFVRLGEFLLNAASTLVTEGQSFTVSDQVSSRIHQKSIEADLAYFENPQYYDTLHVAQQRAAYRPPQIIRSLVTLCSSLLTLIMMVGLLVSLNWLIALILLLVALPAALVRLRFSRILYKWMQRRAATERRTTYLDWMLNSELFAKEIRQYALGKFFSQQHDALRTELRREQMAISLRRTLSETVTQVLQIVALILTLGFVAYQAVLGAITIGSFVMYFQAFQRAQSLLQSVLTSLAQIYEHNLFLGYLFDFLDMKPSLMRPEQPRPIPVPIREGIRFENVTFRYAGSDRTVLNDINLEIKPGELVALVGENGAGKSTLIKLLCRMYDPVEGRITLDGVDMREMDPAEIHRQINTVFQDFNQYQYTVRENIWMGNVHALPDMEAIKKAAQFAGAHEFISQLPAGYDNMLGNWFADGQELSQGQWQKLAIARAFVRDSQLLILDEPSSALDVLTEHEIFEHFREMMKDRAALIISHRLSTTRNADRIYVLHESRIVESGSHDELMAIDGLYAHLFRTQSQHYQPSTEYTAPKIPDFPPVRGDETDDS